MAVSQRPTESSSPRSSGLRPHTAGARLSVVLLATGSLQELVSAVSVLSDRLQHFGAQLVVVRAGDEVVDLEELIDYPFTKFAPAPASAARSDLCDLGMTHASGDIVALRETRNVRDGSWLDSFSGSVAVEAEAERLVAQWDRLGSFDHTPLADVLDDAPRPNERRYPGDFTGPADVSLAPLPIA